MMMMTMIWGVGEGEEPNGAKDQRMITVLFGF